MDSVVPAGFHVALEIDGKTTKTSNKPVSKGEDVVAWDENIHSFVRRVFPKSRYYY